MTYSEDKVITYDSSHEVVFKVAMYLNHVQDYECFETYIFSCDRSNNVDQITLKGDENGKLPCYLLVDFRKKY